MKKSEIMDELKRISKECKPVSKAWYYQILYDTCTLIGIIITSVKRKRVKHFRYKCPECGKGSDDSQVVFGCIYNHEYNKGGNIQK